MTYKIGDVLFYKDSRFEIIFKVLPEDQVPCLTTKFPSTTIYGKVVKDINGSWSREYIIVESVDQKNLAPATKALKTLYGGV